MNEKRPFFCLFSVQKTPHQASILVHPFTTKKLHILNPQFHFTSYSKTNPLHLNSISNTVFNPHFIYHSTILKNHQLISSVFQSGIGGIFERIANWRIEQFRLNKHIFNPFRAVNIPYHYCHRFHRRLFKL